MPNIEKEEQKEVLKQAIQEWLDKKAEEFGKWTLKYLFTALFAACVYFLVIHGFLNNGH